MKKLEIDFPDSGSKIERFPYKLDFRCGEDEARQLAIINTYLCDVTKQPPENQSELLRKTVLFASIWVRDIQKEVEE